MAITQRYAGHKRERFQFVDCDQFFYSHATKAILPLQFSDHADDTFKWKRQRGFEDDGQVFLMIVLKSIMIWQGLLGIAQLKICDLVFLQVY